MPAVAEALPGMVAPVSRRLSRGPRAWVLALLVCTGLALLFAVGVWTHPGSRWLGYTGDPQQTTWFLRWTPYAIGHGWNPLVTTHIAYPQGANLMWNTAVVLLGVVLAPVTLLFGPIVAYNLALVLAFALSGFACWVALRRVAGLGAGAALAGALFYAFSPYTTAHALGQLNMTFAVAPPLVLLLAHEVLVRRVWTARRAGVVLGLVAAGQALVSEEMLASTGVACLVLVLVLVLFARDRLALRSFVPHALRALGWSLPVFAVVMAGPLWVQFGGPQALHGPVQRRGVFVTDLLNLVVPTQSQLLAPGSAVDFSQRFSGNPVEWGGYLGVPLLCVLGFVAVRGWRRGDAVVRVASVCAVVFAVLSLGPTLHIGGVDTGVPLPWRVIEHVPLLGDMLPGRFAMYVDLCAAVLIGVAVQRASELPRVVRRRAALGLMVAGVTVLPAMPLASDTVQLPAFFTSAAVSRLPAAGSVLVVPFSTDFTAPSPMVWQALADMRYRMPEGYAMIPDASGVTHLGPPPTPLSRALRGIAAGRGAPVLTDASRAAYVADLRAWDVRAAVVGPMPHWATAVSFLTALLGCAPSALDGVDVWWSAGANGCG